MSSYRVYLLDGAGRIDLPEWIEAADDADAMRQSQELRKGARKCEVWQGTRLVGTIETSV